ncbi:MAG: 30S ribosomal protein S8 [Methanomicrobiales archaeon]|jgi:small subunit ribosomal protein S8|nr:30S ribosomal protein S8 [Methanomicrobiales archaeon]
MARMNTIADGMSALKNAADKGKADVILEPAGTLLGAMLRIMQEQGYIAGFEFIDDGRGGQFKVHLNGRINKCGAISPRYSVNHGDLEYWEMQYLPSKGFGILILTTSSGVMPHDQARSEGIGGELLGYVF